MKRLLLAQLRVREFSETADFQDPSLSYILRDVICSYCSTCRDIDLLRDDSVTDDEVSRRWRCTHCGNALDTVEIESRLVEEAQRQSTRYLLQDMRCPKTHIVSTRLCASTSDLCAPLAMDVSNADIRAQLSLLLRVAQFHKFEWLESTLQELSD
jgi:DNA polymerase epsilon subunit 1